MGLNISEAQRTRWVDLMLASAQETGMPDAFVRVFARYLDGPSRTTAQVSHLGEARANAMLGPAHSAHNDEH